MIAKFRGGPLDGTVRDLYYADNKFYVHRPAPQHPDDEHPGLIGVSHGIYDRAFAVAGEFDVLYRWRGWQT